MVGVELDVVDGLAAALPKRLGVALAVPKRLGVEFAVEAVD